MAASPWPPAPQSVQTARSAWDTATAWHSLELPQIPRWRLLNHLTGCARRQQLIAIRHSRLWPIITSQHAHFDRLRGTSTGSNNRTASTFKHPYSSAFSMAAASSAYPNARPNRSASIIARLPSCLPWCRCSPSQNRSKLTGQRPCARHCCSGVEPARAPGLPGGRWCRTQEIVLPDYPSRPLRRIRGLPLPLVHCHQPLSSV